MYEVKECRIEINDYDAFVEEVVDYVEDHLQNFHCIPTEFAYSVDECDNLTIVIGHEELIRFIPELLLEQAELYRIIGDILYWKDPAGGTSRTVIVVDVLNADEKMLEVQGIDEQDTFFVLKHELTEKKV